MNKLVASSAAAAALAAGLYVQGLPPFAKSQTGVAASRDAASPNAKSGAREEPAPAVTVVRATIAPLRETVLVTGSLIPRLEVLVAPEVEGLRVMELLADEGDRVKKNQILAMLEQESLRAQLAQNDASQAKAEAGITQARSNIVAADAKRVEATNAFDRAKPLSKTGVLSDSTLDQREAAARTAIAQLRVAEDSLKVAEAERALVEAQRRDLAFKLSRTEVRAPVDGLISRRTAKIGGLASGAAVAQPMFNIITAGEIELEADVPETDLARLVAGQEATISVAGAGELKGKVRLVGAEIDKTTRQGRVRITLGDNPRVRIGNFGRGTVLVRGVDAVVLPAGAVLFGAEGAYVQLVVDNRVVSRKVVAGMHTAEVVEVMSGLKPGEIVVAKSGTFLRSGDLVTPVETRNTAARVN